MKKITSLLLVIILIFAFAACSNNAKNENETLLSVTENQSVSTEPTSENISSAGKTLVVYFSASGNTENAANYIAKATNGDVFEIAPKNAYTDDDLNWRDESSRVNYEHENESARDIELVSATVSNWDSYDTVFIGYPIWWGIAAWPVDSFVKANDFTGKTVVPFCTSTSSGLGDSGKLLAAMAGKGNWLEGERFSSNVSEDTVTAWINELGL
ncbi:MAG: flavodoxin [Eubacterium sp.]|nr:flavodoxin [Eubacterium sp.]